VTERTWTGWKVTAAIIAVVAAGTFLLNLLPSGAEDPRPRRSPAVVTVGP
jgi:hypothetical protein